MKWTFEDLSDQTGKTVVVTGANTGIGFETARALVKKGAHAVLACRSEERGTEAVRRIEAEAPPGSAALMLLDLGSLAAVHRFAEEFQSEHKKLDVLVNNAGVMIPPLAKTEDGFYEMRGYPAPAKILPKARDRKAAEQLWTTAEKLTGVHYLSNSG